LVGLPSKDPYSLPFAHRQLFADNKDNYDLFIYTEDDTLITENNIVSFLKYQTLLDKKEILGFVRSEIDTLGKKYITSINHHFRWLPDSVSKRGDEFFAKLSNDHSGCFIATREQLNIALGSGNFLVRPYKNTYGMLETAATDIYTCCGLTRLICISKIENFILPHLANKYIGKMGFPLEEMDRQIQYLKDSHRDNKWKGSLFNPQTKFPNFRGSKNLYEKVDFKLLEEIPVTAETVLSVGCGWGANESWLMENRRIEITAVPIDSAFANSLHQRGIKCITGPIEDVLKKLNGRKFDVILIDNILHLLRNPIFFLSSISENVSAGGYVVASVINTTELVATIRAVLNGHGDVILPKFEEHGTHLTNRYAIKKWFRKSNFSIASFECELSGSNRLRIKKIFPKFHFLFANRFIVKATLKN
jgi:2-polyprenyl-3-methyl-5-hydroxy-6-metoxy-1,4-benzoquinol methylase